MAERQVAKKEAEEAAKKEAEEAAEEAEEAEEEAAEDEAGRILSVLIDAIDHTSARARPCARPRPPEVVLVSRL